MREKTEFWGVYKLAGVLESEEDADAHAHVPMCRYVRTCGEGGGS